jgi:hypothetical protein
MGSDLGDIVAADTSFIISLDDARAGIGMPLGGSAVTDADLRVFMGAATPIMEDIVGPIIARPLVETYDGGTTQINLLWAPLISVTSIVESWGSSYVRPITGQDIFAGTALDSYGYSVDLVTGIITRRATGMAIPFAAGKRNIQVTYVAGRAAVSGNVMLATRILIRYLWSQSRLRSPLVNNPPEPLAYTPRGYAVPIMVVELCADSTRAQGLA